MRADSITFAKEIAGLSPTLTALLEDHMEDNFGEVLPHVFFGDVTRHVIGLVRASSPKAGLDVRRELKTIVDRMEVGYATGSAEVQELIAVSFLENLPEKPDPGSEIRGMLGRMLKSQLKKMT